MIWEIGDSGGVPAENIVAMYDAAYEFGWYDK